MAAVAITNEKMAQFTTDSDVATNRTSVKANVEGNARAPAMLTVDEVAAMLRCSARTVYRLADAGRIPPPCRLGGLVRWNAAAVESWIGQGCPDCRKTLRR